MADNEIKVILTGDTSGLSKAVGDASALAQKLRAEFDKAFSGISSITANVSTQFSVSAKEMQMATQQLSASVQGLTKQLAAQTPAVAATTAAQTANTAATAANTAAQTANAAAVAKTGLATVGARREIMVLAHELLTGNFKRAAGSVMVLGERMDWMHKIMSPLGLSIAAVGAALAACAFEFVKGTEESIKFNNSLLLTGNYAGITEGQFNALSQTISDATNATIGSSREMMQALVSSGRFSGESLDRVGLAAVRLQEVSGRTADEVAKDMVRMSDNTYRWAMESNEQYHFLDAATLQYIKTLQDQGNQEKAEQVVATALYNHLGTTAVGQLGYLEQAWYGVRNAISATINEMKAWGRTATTEEQIATLQQKQADASKGGVLPSGAGMMINPFYSLYHSFQNRKFTDADQTQLKSLLAQQEKERAAAAAKAKKDKADLDKAKAQDEWSKTTTRYKTSKEQEAEEIATARSTGARAGASQSEIDATVAKIRQRWEGKPKKARGGGGAGNPIKLEQAQNRADLSEIKPDYTAQIDQLKAMYDQGLLTTQQYYDKQKALSDQETQAILDNLEKQKQAAEKGVAGAKNGAGRIAAASQLAAIEAKIANVKQQQAAAEAKIADARAKAERADEAQFARAQKMLSDMTGHADPSAELKGWMASNEKMLRDLRTNFAQAGNDLADKLINVERVKANTQAIDTQIKTLEAQIGAIQAGAPDAYGGQKGSKKGGTGGAGSLFGGAELAARKKLYAQEITLLQQKLDQEKSLGDQADQEEIARTEQKLAEVKKQYGELDPFIKTIADSATNALGQLTDSIMSGTKKWGDAFKDFFKSIAQSINQAVSRSLANMLMNELGLGGIGGAGGGGGPGGGGSGGGGGGIGGLFGSLMSWVGGGASSMLSSMFGGGMSFAGAFTMPGGGAGAALSAAPDIGSYMSTLGGVGGLLNFSMPGLAVGGYLSEGVPTLVGEQGPELIIPGGRAGKVVNANETARRGGGGGNTVNMHISTPDANSFRASQNQTMTAYTRALSRTANRNT